MGSNEGTQNGKINYHVQNYCIWDKMTKKSQKLDIRDIFSILKEYFPKNKEMCFL